MGARSMRRPAPIDSPEALGIERKPSGYWGTGGEVDRRLTNFLLEPISVFLEESQHGDITRRGQHQV